MKILAFILALAFTTPAFAAEGHESAFDRVMKSGTLRCGYGIWPPFFEVDVNTGELKGMIKDMSDGIANILDLKFEYVPVVIGPSAAQDLKTGKVDAICGDGPWALTSMKALNYTRSYLYAGLRVYGRADENRVTTLDQFNNPELTFVGVDGDSTTDMVSRSYPKAKLNAMPGTTDPSQLFMDIVTKKADFILTDPLTAAEFMKNNPGKIKEIVSEPVAVNGAGFSLDKSELELLETLNEATKAAINVGLVDKVIKQYDPDEKFFLAPVTDYERH